MKYNVEFKGTSNRGEYNMTGTVDIYNSKCFKYGNGKSLTINCKDNSNGYNINESYDIRYDRSYSEKNEVVYITKFIKNNYQNISSLSVQPIE